MPIATLIAFHILNKLFFTFKANSKLALEIFDEVLAMHCYMF